MNCAHVSAELTAYLDGELDAVTASAMRGHLRVCAACRAAAEDHAAIRDSLAEMARPEPPAAVWSQVLARLGEAEIADSRRSRWSRMFDRMRPHMVPAGLAAAACAVAVLVIQLRGTDDGGAPLAADELPATAVERADMGEPGPTPDRQVGPRAPAVDATAELAAEAERVEARFRTTAADLLPLARAEHRGAGLRRFDREVAALEAAVVRAPAGKARDRAWHTLLGFLERAALGEPGQRVAVNP